MKTIVCTFTILGALVASAAATNEQELVKFGNKMVTRAHMRNAIRKARLRQTGGYVRRENSAKGQLVVLNAQKTVPQGEIEAALATIDRQVRIQTKVVAADGITLDNIKAKVADAEGSLGIVVVEGGAYPALLDAPEEGWAIVNVVKLAADGPAADRLAARTRREVLRGFACIAGGICSTRDPLMQPVVTLHDIDGLAREEYGVTLLNTFPLSLPYYGIKPWYQRTYAKALEEGWAPKPADEFQQNLWDKVHALPTEPIKIQPETKKVTE